MSIPVLIMGESGTGKSASLRGFEPGEVGLVNVQGKPLPFRTKIKGAVIKGFETILEACKATDKRAVVVDDFGYAITDYYVRHSLGKDADRDQYEVFKVLAAKVYNLIDGLIRDGNESKVVYLIMHTEETAKGGVQPLTVGKLLNEKIKIVGMVTVCLISAVEDGRYVFKTNGEPPAKSPVGMFEDARVDNDLKAVDAAVRDYWSLAPLSPPAQEVERDGAADQP